MEGRLGVGGCDPIAVSQRAASDGPNALCQHDNTVRKARVNALFSATKMAASLAASDGETTRQTASVPDSEIVSLSDVRETPRQAATG